MYVCLCKGLTESDVRRIIQSNCNGEPHRLPQVLGLDDDDCCGRCARNVQELVAIASSHCWTCNATAQPDSPY